MSGRALNIDSMIIAQISDLHAVPPGERLDGVDTNAMIEQAVCHLNGLVPAPGVVLVTGDLAEGGCEASYLSLRRALDRLEAPYYVIAGNHDRRDALRTAFHDHVYLPRDGFLQYAIETYPLRLVALDTLDEGRGGGRLCDRRLEWVDETLAAQPESPTLLFMHHPPFETGIGWMDKSAFVGGEAFERLLERHRQVRRVICGHLHRAITTTLGATTVSVVPSTCYQVHLNLAPAATPHIVMEPPACHLHVWTGSRLMTHESFIAGMPSPIDLSKPVA